MAKVAKDEKKAGNATVAAAFGAKNRERLITQYFSERPAPEKSPAWAHVYRLLLWIDQTTGLAHCYESDKSQPGKPWYPRVLAFHDWVGNSLGVSPHTVGEHVDWLFKRATLDLASHVLAKQASVITRAKEQRKPTHKLFLPGLRQSDSVTNEALNFLSAGFIGIIFNADPAISCRHHDGNFLVGVSSYPRNQ